MPVCEDCGGSDFTKWGTRPRAGGRSQALKCKGCGRQASEPLYSEHDEIGSAPKSAKRYVITSAQNMTAVHKRFLASLRTYCKSNSAELVVIPFRYRNPTSQKEYIEDWYAPEIRDSLMGKRVELCKGLVVLGDIKTQPTAVNPLSGMQTITGGSSGIFGHTKVCMESVATPGQKLPKLLYTTGACTVENYSDTKAGKKGEFHHVLGALVIEVCDKYHIRHLAAQSDGSFIDLGKKYTGKKQAKAPRPSAFVMGDLHAVRKDEKNFDACMEIIDSLKPRKVVLHDVLDFQSASHHNGYFERFRLSTLGQNSVIDELRLTCAVLDQIAAKADVYVVMSNHHEHLYKWLQDHNNGLDLDNAVIYHELKAEMLRAIQDGKGIPDPLELCARKFMKRRAKFVSPPKSFQVHGIELGYHGHKGPNGARGNIRGFDKIGVKTVVGHSHTPGIVGGCWQVGTSSDLNLGYNADSPSGWLHSHVMIHGNGKRTHINVIDGEWRADEISIARG